MKNERKRAANGTFRRAVEPGAGGAVELKTQDPAKPLRPSQCGAYMRRTLAAELPEILRGLVQGARSGSCPHVKLATELLQPGPGKTTRRKSSAEKLLDGLKWD